MLNYVKFMKEIMSNKKNLDAYGMVSLSKNCSAIIQRKLHEKLKDPSSFIIPCIIGEHTYTKTLCDLGANINLMPFSVAKKLNLGVHLSHFKWRISMTFPKGIIEDVLVKVDKFIFPVDFVVSGMEEDENVPLSLGRPFLATSRALIDVESGELTLRVGDDKVCLNIYKSDKLPKKEKATCMKVKAMPLQGVENMKMVPKETVTPRPERVYDTCNCRVVYVHQGLP